LVENKRLTLNFEVQGGYKGIVIFDEKLKVIKKELIHD
jgi:hypothetical protein